MAYQYPIRNPERLRGLALSAAARLPIVTVAGINAVTYANMTPDPVIAGLVALGFMAVDATKAELLIFGLDHARQAVGRA